MCPITGDGDGAMLVGAKDRHVLRGEDAQNVRVGMPISIASTEGHDGYLRPHVLDEGRQRRGLTPMVRDLQDVRLQVWPVC
jgi:hypothetical protein